MSEYHDDLACGRDDCGTVCPCCERWFDSEATDYCSAECEASGPLFEGNSCFECGEPLRSGERCMCAECRDELGAGQLDTRPHDRRQWAWERFNDLRQEAMFHLRLPIKLRGEIERAWSWVLRWETATVVRE